MDPIIEVSHLSRHFLQSRKQPGFKGSMEYIFHRKTIPIFAVEDINFSIHKGEFIGFIGANGAGKTTTLKMLSGILHPSKGNIHILGFTPSDRKYAFLEKIALVMGQKSQLQWDLPVYDTLLFNKELYRVTDEVFSEQLKELTNYLGLHELLQVPARKLSLGQRMKCELAASLIHSPEILFLDEPTIGLDVAVQQSIREFLKKYNEEKKITIILTSHYMDDIEALCKRVIMINKGKIIYDGNINELMSRYVHEKYVSIEFVEPTNADLPGRIIQKDEMKVVMALPKEGHTSIVATILQQYAIKDITIAEPSLEEIIRNIFLTSNA